jgi:DNA polymerase delta subunit 2
MKDCHPFKDSDPFILNERPNVFFIGNQPSYQSKIVESEYGNTRLVLIPEFSKSKTLVLLNSRTFETRTISFQT